ACRVGGMAALVDAVSVRILRPLLGVPPDDMRAMLAAAGIAWFEDPSNVDATALRPRLRLARRDRAGMGSATAALVAASAALARRRADADRDAAAYLANRVTLRPEGF